MECRLTDEECNFLADVFCLWKATLLSVENNNESHNAKQNWETCILNKSDAQQQNVIHWIKTKNYNWLNSVMKKRRRQHWKTLIVHQNDQQYQCYVLNSLNDKEKLFRNLA